MVRRPSLERYHGQILRLWDLTPLMAHPTLLPLSNDIINHLNRIKTWVLTCSSTKCKWAGSYGNYCAMYSLRNKCSYSLGNPFKTGKSILSPSRARGKTIWMKLSFVLKEKSFHNQHSTNTGTRGFCVHHCASKSHIAHIRPFPHWGNLPSNLSACWVGWENGSSRDE